MFSFHLSFQHLYFYILDKIKEKDDMLNVKFNYILDEIDIRVESIRIQVEESSKSLKEKVEMMRNELLK